MTPEQGNIFDAIAVARNTDPETSHAAARSITSAKLRASQEAVFNLLRREPMCDERLVHLYIVERCKPEQSTSGLRTRRAELVALCRARDSGKRQKLVSGRMAIVWEVTP